eukprot:1178909-Prymnesium_polylepis.1
MTLAGMLGVSPTIAGCWPLFVKSDWMHFSPEMQREKQSLQLTPAPIFGSMYIIAPGSHVIISPGDSET